MIIAGLKRGATHVPDGTSGLALLADADFLGQSVGTLAAGLLFVAIGVALRRLGAIAHASLITAQAFEGARQHRQPVREEPRF